MKVSEKLDFVFIYAIIGTIIFRRWSMTYLFEILPSLLSGATMTLQVFALGFTLFNSFRYFGCLLLTGPLETPPLHD